MKEKTEKRILYITFLFPLLLLYTGFVIIPSVQSLYVSLFKWSGFTMQMEKYVGLDNFKRIFSDPVITIAIKNNLFYYFLPSILIIILSLCLAEYLTTKVKKGNIAETIIFFPNILSKVIVATIWVFVFSPNFGMLNTLMTFIGLGKFTHAWLGEEKFLLQSISFVIIWEVLGFYLILFRAYRKSIPMSIYESALIDGASSIRVFFKITLPLISDGIKIAVVLLTAYSFQSFETIFILTDGGPSNASINLPLAVYKYGFQFSQKGYAAAISVLIFTFVFVISMLVYRIFKRDAIEY